MDAVPRTVIPRALAISAVSVAIPTARTWNHLGASPNLNPACAMVFWILGLSGCCMVKLGFVSGCFMESLVFVPESTPRGSKSIRFKLIQSSLRVQRL